MVTRWCLLSLVLLLLSGCLSRGLLYTRVTDPATGEFHQTPVGSKRIFVRTFRVQEPVTGYGVSAEWAADPVKTAALQAGVTNLYFADVETLSILGGLYRARTLIIYGD